MPTKPSVDCDRIFRFGPFELSEREGELRKSGVRIKLQEQPFRVLVELVANSGKVVTREELQQKLWPADTFVDFDVGLNSAIRKLRQALADDADSPRYIETLAKRGYKFIAPVADSAAVHQPSKGSPVEGLASSTSDGTNSATGEEIQHKPRRWYWVLAATCVLALLIYGGVLAWRRANTPPPLATEQQITANPREAPVTGAVVSPDGKYVAYSDTTGVYIRHIDTGETRPLQLPKGFSASPTSWFPDGTHLLVSTQPSYGPIDPGGVNPILESRGTPGLWKVSLLGGSPQKLINDASWGAVSPDGSKIAFLRADAGATRDIWVMAADGSNAERVVKAVVPKASVAPAAGSSDQMVSGVSVDGIAWSPDGKWLAYVRRFEVVKPLPTEDRHSLEIVGVKGGTPKVVKVSRHLLPVVCWASDGRLLYGYRNDPSSERTDYGIWWVPVSQRSGEPNGKAIQLTGGTGRIGGMSVSADGKRLVIWRDNLSPTVLLAEFDVSTHLLAPPRRLTLDENSNIATDWTPDSRAILFISNRGGTYKVFRQAIDQAVPEVLVEGRFLSQPRVSPNGKEVLYLAAYNPEDPAQLGRVMAVPLAGGPSRVVLQVPFTSDIMCTRTGLKQCLLVGKERAVWFDPDNGNMRPFAPFQWTEFESWSLSLDGSQLALVPRGSNHRILFFTINDGRFREVELTEMLSQGMDWTADSKSLFVTAEREDGSPVVLFVEPSGSQHVLLEGDKATQFWWSIPSPDGRYVALEEVTGTNNVWMIENF